MKTEHFAVNTIVFTLARGLSLGGRAIVLLVLAWTGTPASLASSTIIVTLAETARFIGDLGVETWLIRRMGLAESVTHGAKAGRIALWLRVICAAAAAVAVWYVARAVASLGPGTAAIAALLTITGLITGVPIAIMQARLEMHRLLYSQIPILIVGLTFVVSAARHHASAESTLFILAAFECLAVGATLLQSDLLKPLNRHVSLTDIGDAFRDCLPVALFNALVGAYSRLDVWFLAWMSAASLPTYTVAFRLYQPWSLITASIAGVAYAGMARTVRHRANLGIIVTRKLVLTGLACASGLMLILIGAGVAVICQFLPQYRNAILVLAILALLIPIMGFNGLCTAVLSVAGKFNTLCRLAGFNLLVFATLLLALITPYGAAGAALALLIGETCNALIQAWLLRPYTVRPHMAKDGFNP